MSKRKSLPCEHCGRIVENVAQDAVKVVCWLCVMGEATIESPPRKKVTIIAKSQSYTELPGKGKPQAPAHPHA